MVVLATVGVVPRQLCDPAIKVSALSKWSKTHLFFQGGRGWWWSRWSLVNLQECYVTVGTSARLEQKVASPFDKTRRAVTCGFRVISPTGTYTVTDEK